MYGTNSSPPSPIKSPPSSRPRPVKPKLAYFSVLPTQRSPLMAMVLAARPNQFQSIIFDPDSQFCTTVKQPPLNGMYVFATLLETSPAYKVVTRISLVPATEGSSAHCSLLDSLDMEVLYAGTITFVNNKIIVWTNRSGSFQIEKKHALQANLPLDLFRPID